MMVKLWSKAAVPSFAFCGCLIIADATLRATNPHYSFWVGLLDVGVCVTATMGIIGVICKFLNDRALARRRVVLGEGDLRKIGEISAKPGLTWVQKRLLLRPPYSKKLIEVSGAVIDIVRVDRNSSRVTVQTCVLGLTAHMDFSDKHTFDYPLLALVPNQKLTVIGKIDDIDPSGISLVNWEIMSIGTLGAGFERNLRPNSCWGHAADTD
jgi:hypothetical protein